MDGLGDLPGLPGAAAEFAQDVPGLELGVRALTGEGAEPGMGLVGLFLEVRLVFLGTGLANALACADVALVDQGDQPGGVQQRP